MSVRMAIKTELIFMKWAKFQGNKKYIFTIGHSLTGAHMPQQSITFAWEVKNVFKHLALSQSFLFRYCTLQMFWMITSGSSQNFMINKWVIVVQCCIHDRQKTSSRNHATCNDQKTCKGDTTQQPNCIVQRT